MLGKVISLIVFFFSYSLQGSAQEMAQNYCEFEYNDYEYVSMINIIATPEKYDGKMIYVEGILSLEFEDERLYFSKETYKNWITQSSVRVRLSGEMKKSFKYMQGEYAIIIGVFKSTVTDSRNYEIRKICRIQYGGGIGRSENNNTLR